MSSSNAPYWDAVLFDLDGTLANTIPLILASFAHAMSVHRPGEAPDEQALLANVGRTLDETLREFEPDSQARDAFRTTYLDRQRELHDEMVTPFPGALFEVEWLRGARIPIAIVTSKGREMTDRSLSVCALDIHFEHVVTADDVTRGKPDPEPIHRALELLGVSASSRVLFVGDSPHDVDAGRAAGVSTVGVTWGVSTASMLDQAAPDYRIRHFEELRRLEAPG